MPAAKRKVLVEPGSRGVGRPRAADPTDAPVASPVHRLQSDLLAVGAIREEAQSLYPGWFRLGFPVAASSVLWAIIAWSCGWLG